MNLITAFPNLFEQRTYKTGWVFRIGRFLIRWNKQENYRSLSAEWLGPSFQLVGGKRNV